MSSKPKLPEQDPPIQQLQNGEEANRRGQLKIFLGYAAGVGKTYALLEAAHRRKAEGIDVVVGCAETHQLTETEALLIGLVDCFQIWNPARYETVRIEDEAAVGEAFKLI